MLQLGLYEQLLRYDLYFAAVLAMIPTLAIGWVGLSSFLGRPDAHPREPRLVLRTDNGRSTVMVIEYARDGLTSHVLAGSSVCAGQKRAFRDAA